MKLGMIHQYDSDAFAYVKGKGLAFIECCRNNDEEAQDFINHVGEIKENIAESGIPIGSVGRWAARVNENGRLDPLVMQKQKDLLQAAIEVHSPVFVCGCNYDATVSLYKNYTAAIEYFGALLEYAKDSSTQVAVYNCDWENFVNNMTAWDIVLGELPTLKIKYDCSHSYYAGRDYLEEINKWANRFAHMHIKGAVKINGRYMDDPPAGMDALPWSQIFAMLYARGYNGNLSIEPHSATWRGDTELGKRGLNYTIHYISQFILQ